MKKLQVLVNWLAENDYNATEVKLSSWNENVIETDEGDFLVLTDEEADEEFREYQQNLIDEMGIECFAEWARDYILGNFVDEEWFNDYLKESNESYIEDIKHEEGRLEEEMEERGVETEDEFLESLNDDYDNSIEWFIDNFGNEDFNEVVNEKDLIDWDEVIEWLLQEDGRTCLAGYDGEENEYIDNNGETYYIYRTN